MSIVKKFSVVTVLLAFTLCGCASLKSFFLPKAQVEKTQEIAALPAYSGPKARVAIADFEIKAVKADQAMGSVLRKELTESLLLSNRFQVAERKSQGQAKPEESLIGDLIISAAVIEFEPEASGGRLGVGGGGSAASAAFGGLLGTTSNKAYLSLDIRIVDNLTSKVLAANKVQGQATDREKAISICIAEAVHYIAQAAPKEYYKY